ncbi:MAG: hypothetical protein SEPTF4163_005436 [Sporothrix epigloea]
MAVHGSTATSSIESTKVHNSGTYGHFSRMLDNFFSFVNAKKQDSSEVAEDHEKDVPNNRLQSGRGNNFGDFVPEVLPTHRATTTRTTQHLTALPTGQATKKARVQRSDAVARRLTERDLLPDTPAADSLLTDLPSSGALLSGSAAKVPLKKKSDALSVTDNQEPIAEQVKPDAPAKMPLSPATLPPSFTAMDKEQTSSDDKTLGYILNRSSSSGSSHHGFTPSTFRSALCVAVLVCTAAMAVF